METDTLTIEPTEPMTRDDLKADRPTWCPGCGDFSVLAMYQKFLVDRQYPQEKIATLSGIGCSSRFPYFINTHSVHFIHGRIIPFATALSLTRPELFPFVIIGDGDAFSIGGNHLTHAARKNVNLNVIILNNQVYGLTKKQTSPTSPLGFRSKTDPWGSRMTPVNPARQIIGAGATFFARASAANPKHLIQMYERMSAHEGFSVLEVLSECVQFFKGSFDGASSGKGGEFVEIGPDHDVTDEGAAFALAEKPFPGVFGVFHEVRRTTLNEMEQENIRSVAPAELQRPTVDKLKDSFNRLT